MYGHVLYQFLPDVKVSTVIHWITF